MEDYPGNSYKERGIMKHFPTPSHLAYENDEGHYFVRLKYTIWPSIYGKELPIHFPTQEAAMTFAKNNITSTIIRARVYTPSGKLVMTFD